MNERLGLLLLTFGVLVIGLLAYFTWNAWKSMNEVVSLRKEIGVQAKTIRDLRVEVRELSETASLEAAAPTGEVSPTPEVEDRVETSRAAPERVDAEALREAERINTEFEIERLTGEADAQSRVLQNLDQLLTSLRDQLLIYDAQDQNLKEQRRRALEEEQRAIALRLEEIELSNQVMNAQIADIRTRAPGWRFVLELDALQNSLTQNSRETVALMEKRRTLEKEQIARQQAPEPEIAYLRAEVQRSLQNLQSTRTAEADRLADLQRRMVQAQQRRGALTEESAEGVAE